MPSQQDLYTANGQKVTVLAKTANDTFIVQTQYTYTDYIMENGDQEIIPGSIFEVDKVYTHPPKEIYYREIETLIQRKEQIEAERAKIYDQVLELKKELKEVQEVMNQRKNEFGVLAELSQIDDFIKLRLPFVVVDLKNSFDIIDIRLETSRKGFFKLLTLGGRYDKEGVILTWHINEYTDGSGQTYNAYLCKNKDDAWVLIKRLLEAKSVSEIEAYYKFMMENDLPIPEEVANNHYSHAILYHERRIKDSEKDIEYNKSQIEIIQKEREKFIGKQK